MPPKKKNAKTESAPKSPRLDYYRDRNNRLVSFVVEDLDLKRRIQEAADADGRAVNNWMVTHILPKIEDEANRQLAKRAAKQ